MDMEEYGRVKGMGYLEYCGYLQGKYGIPKRPYMTESWNRVNTISRTAEGLVVHHRYEDHAIMLSVKAHAIRHPYEWQMPESLIYCDYLEHLLLHVLICENPAVPAEVSGETVGVGGVVNYIVPELNDAYSGFRSKQGWRNICYERVLSDEEVYLLILDRFLDRRGRDKDDATDLLTSFNARYGIWKEENNSGIYQKIMALIV